MGAILEQLLAPLERYFRDDVEEVRANRPGHLWIIPAGGGDKREVDAPELDLRHWWQVLRTLANTADRTTTAEQNPRVGALLPGGHRLQLNLGGHVQSGVAATIRLKHPRRFALSDYLGDADDGGARDDLRERVDLAPVELLERAVARRENILIAGGTATGKTAFLNALAALAPERDRLLTVEDVPEVDTSRFVDVVRFTPILGESREAVSYRHIMDDVVRHSPQRILVGECRMDNSWLVLKTLNVGHDGFMGTIHANNPKMALEALLTNIRLAPEAAGIPRADVEAVVLQTLDLVVQIRKRKDGKRVLAEVLDLRRRRLEQDVKELVA